MVFFEDKIHLGISPSGRVDKASTVKMNISPKMDTEDLVTSNNILEQDKEIDMKEETEADVPATKSTRSNEALKFDVGKKTATKPWAILGTWISFSNLL